MLPASRLDATFNLERYVMKTRRHHNNKGYRQIKRGKTYQQVQAMARRLFQKAQIADVAATSAEGGRLGNGCAFAAEGGCRRNDLTDAEWAKVNSREGDQDVEGASGVQGSAIEDCQPSRRIEGTSRSNPRRLDPSRIGVR